MKRLLFIPVFWLLLHSAFAQGRINGYMGKKLSVFVAQRLEMQIAGNALEHGTFLGSEVGLDLVLNRRWTVGVKGSPLSFDLDNTYFWRGNTTMFTSEYTGVIIGAEARSFRARKNGAIAPIGSYVKFGWETALHQGTTTVQQTGEVTDEYTNGMSHFGVFGFGYQRALFGILQFKGELESGVKFTSSADHSLVIFGETLPASQNETLVDHTFYRASWYVGVRFGIGFMPI